jgi:hypothetical protein
MKQADEQWMAELKRNPVYSGINIDREVGKMEVWLSLRPGRKMTRRFIVNWLNKIDAPIVINKPNIGTVNFVPGQFIKTEQPSPPPKEWRELIDKIAKAREV